MSFKRCKFFIPFILLLTIGAILGGCEIRSRNTFADFARLIENGDYENLRLTIYFTDPHQFSRLWSVDFLVDLYPDSYPFIRKFVIDGDHLVEYSDLLNQLSNVAMIPSERANRINARIYYIFENIRTGRVFEVVISSWHNTLHVNGIEVESNYIFYDVILPFLPEDAVELIELFIGRRVIED